MSETAVQAEGLSKKYRLRHEVHSTHRTLRDAVSDAVAGVLRQRQRTPRPSFEEFWALRDVSFQIGKGEVVGIIGRNGAGKSTLLKVLSRITEPTSGRVVIRGRVASLLEVGTGFHPELTGGENIFLNGAILGMSRSEIRAKFDLIVDFAEISRFIDTPVKRYSSGMYVRLAFAVAAHLDPEILVIDEVLSVGDVEFQRKCLGVMNDVATRRGRTVLFVSHNLRAVQDLCDSAVLMRQGQVAFRGDVGEAIKQYLDDGDCHREWRPNSSEQSRAFAFLRIEVRGAHEPDPQYDDDLVFNFEYEVRDEVPANRIVFNVRTADGLIVFESAETDQAPSERRRYTLGRFSAAVTVPSHLLGPGKYYLSVSAPRLDAQSDIFENVLSFTVGERGSPTARGNRPGVIKPTFAWTTQDISA